MEITPEQQKELYVHIRSRIQAKLQSLQLHFENVQLAPGSKKGEAHLGKLLQITVQAKNRGMQTTVHLMGKFTVSTPFLRDHIPLANCYQREISMYEDVFPRFSQLQSDIVKPFIGYPEYYASSLIDLPEYVIMSDLKYDGYKTLNRVEPLDLPHMMLVMKEYARFHALSFALRHREPDFFRTIAAEFEIHIYPTLKDEEANYVQIHWQRALRTLNFHTHRKILKRFDGVAANFYERMLAATAGSKAKEYGVLCHGDCSITNLMFKYSQDRFKKSPTELSLVDFQLAKLSSPAVDLSHLIFTCTDKQMRDHHYLELLQEYHKHLIDFGKELQTDIDMPFNLLLEHMKQFSIYGLYMVVTNLYLQMSSDDDIPSMDVILNWSDAANHFIHPCSNKEAFEARMRDVLIDYDSYGYDV